MTNVVWKHIQSGRKLSKTEVIEELDQKSYGVAVLSGPSNCGKTMLLKEMRCHSQIPMFIYTCEQVADSILSVAQDGCLSEGVPIFKKHPLNTILAIEDVDYYLSGREYTRHMIYDNIQHLTKDCLIILSGIDIELRLPDIFNYFPNVDFYCATADGIAEIWDLYDEHENKIPGAFHIRTKQIPAGCYHLVVNVLIRDRQGKYLLGQRSADRKSFPLMWEGAGGSVLMGETALEAGIREAYEELGIRLESSNGKLIHTQVRETGRNGKPYRDILKTYLFELDEIIWHPELAPTKEEVADSRLFTLLEIYELYQTDQLHPDLDYIFGLLA